MPRLAICSHDLHWHWINRTLLCDTMEVSMLSRAWLTIAQHVFQPALTGRPELISRKIVSGEPGTKAIAVSRFREKIVSRELGPRCYHDFAENIALLGAKKMGSYMRPRYIQFRDIHDRDISGLHCTNLDILWDVIGAIALITYTLFSCMIAYCRLFMDSTDKCERPPMHEQNVQLNKG